MFEDLRLAGLAWDGEPLVQSQRTELYAAALDRLRERGLVYACFCTRADIAAVADRAAWRCGDVLSRAPAAALPDDPERRATTPHSWRLDSAKALAIAGLPTWTEADGQAFRSRRERHRRRHPRPQGCAVVLSPRLRRRRCGIGVDLVVRGEDLRPSTPIQRAAADAARPARADLPPSSAGHCMTTAAGWPSATSRRRWRRCAKRASTGRRWQPSCCAGQASPWFRLLARPRAAP